MPRAEKLECARCFRPIGFRELYHRSWRAAMIGDERENVVVQGAEVLVHDYPCPS